MSKYFFKTPKGTELPVLDLKGKDYLQVAHRLVWFREDHPDWSIETQLLSVTDQSAYARAEIKDEKGRVLATAHKFENMRGFPDFIEKSETGAIGRALAHVGYGTQFAPEILEVDEGEESRLADSPVPNKRNESPKTKPEPYSGEPANYIARVGRVKGQALCDISPAALTGALKWAEANKPTSADWKEFIEQANKFLNP